MSGTPWNAKLRGVTLYEDGVQLPFSGRVSGINFLNSALSYNRITGIATVSIGEAVDLSVTPNRILGRYSTPAGPHEEITPSGNIELTSLGVLQRGALTGDVTAAAGSGSTSFRTAPGLTVLGRSASSSGAIADITGTSGALRIAAGVLAFGTLATADIGDSQITHAKYQDIAGLSVLGRSAGTTGVVGAITGTEGQALRISGGVLGFGTLPSAVLGDIATDRILGRDTAGTGPAEQLTVSGGIRFTGSGGIDLDAFTGDVTKTAGGTALTIANNAVTNAHLRDSAAVSVIGRSVNTSGDPADIAAGANDRLFARVSDALSFTQLTNGMVPTNTIGLDKLVNVAAQRLLGNPTGSPASASEISLDATLEFSSTTLRRVAIGGDITIATGSNTSAFRNMTARSVWARAANSTGAPAELSGGGANTVLYDTGTALTFGALPSAAITPPGSTTQVFYNNAGAWDAASGVTIIDSETGIKASHFDGPGAVPTSGVYRVAENPGAVLTYFAADGSTTRNVIELAGDGTTFTDLVIGENAGASAASGGNNALYLKAYDFVGLMTRGGAAFTADFAGNLIVEQNGRGIYGRSSAGTGSVARHMISIAGDNVVTVGDLALNSELDLTAVLVDVLSNGHTVRFAETAVDLNNIPILDATYFAATGTPAGIGTFRGVNNSTLVAAKTSGGTDYAILGVTNGNQILIGSTSVGEELYVDVASGKTVNFRFGNANPWQLSAGIATTDASVSGAGLRGLDVANASSQSLRIQGPGSTSSNNDGGALILRAGAPAGSGQSGAVRMQLDTGGDQPNVAQGVEIGGRAILGLCYAPSLTSSEMPSGTGDGVAFVGNAVTAPSAGSSSNPAGGGILYRDNTEGIQGLRFRDLGNVHSTLSYARGATGSNGDYQGHKLVGGLVTLNSSTNNILLHSINLNEFWPGTNDGTMFLVITVHAVCTDEAVNSEWIRHIQGVHRRGGIYSVITGQRLDSSMGPALTTAFDITGSGPRFLNIRVNNINSTKTFKASCWVELQAMTTDSTS